LPAAALRLAAMKLTRLRLHGFKSFVDSADIPIQPGITGVVGPNGCGKSNLIEALRFVMGESSYKAMRGGGMDDVIFSGAANRPGRNVAEVTLVAEREAASGHGMETLEIVRRIEREAGSTYRINGREVRARDVQLLFADAATGAHSSALVRQGQVAELIAAKPVQRRGILEDAAGISGLHSRRGEAEQKLKAAEQNLERLDDVMTEIGGRLEGLRRQARQAVRYRKLSGEIRKSEAVLQVLNWNAAVSRLSEAETELGEATAAFAAAAAAQAEAARNEAVAGRRLPELRDQAAAAGAALQRLRLAAADLDREEARLKARREELSGRRAQAAADLRHESEIGSDATAAFARLDEEEAKLRQDGEAAAERIAAARALAEEAGVAAAAVEAEFSAAAGALAAASAERSARERSMREAQTKLRRLEEERGAVVKQRDKLQAEHGGDVATKAGAAAVAEAEAALAEREAQARGAETALASAHDTERRAAGPREAAERQLGALQAEARTLAELLDLENTRRFPPLIDSLDVAPGYERALVAALGDDLDASLDPEAPAYWGTCGPADLDLALPYGAEPLTKFVKGPETLLRRLRQIGVATEESANTLLPELASGQRLVTREGGLWRWDGFRAQAGSAAAGARRLEQRNRVAQLVQELKIARQAADRAGDLYETAKQVRADAEKLDHEGRDGVREARKALDGCRAALAETERRASRIGERLSAFAGALARIEADTDATRIELRSASEALQALAETSELQARRDALQTRLAEHRGRAGELRLEAEKAAHEDVLRARRSAELVAERERWATRVKRAEERVQELTARLAQIDSEIAAIPDDPAAFEVRRRRLLAEIGDAEAAAAAAADALAAAETEQRGAADAARAALEALAQSRERRARDEERRISAGTRRDELAAQIREHFDCAPHELRFNVGLEDDLPLPTAAAAEDRLHKLKVERERLGAVNLRAEEETREIEMRLDSMQAERGDLEAAIQRLRQGIQSLNREGRERLLAAFEAVNGHFRSLFHHLFGGGTAELTLTDSDDPLEAGLEIVARPPGKRPQTMTLLSGGEQALTALSLIFAVFLTNPSPICVLDEVDAPLDDANVDRFCALLDDMRKRTDTRFVVVTHNPITMARMDRLYGVTMAEQGVSQVVSVDLATAERFREAS
jgi:chromosome segregation protein